MSENITSRIYTYFKGRKSVLILLILVLFSGSLWLASKLKFEEDITRLLPGSTSDEKINLQEIIKEFNVADRIVFTVSGLEDDSTVISSDQLISATDSLVQNIRANSNALIKEIKYTIPQAIIQEVYDVVYHNLPVLLTDSDYIALEQMITPEKIESTLEKNYKTLVSPAGMVVKKFIVKDPLHLSNLVLSRLNSSFVSDNFIIYNEHILTKDKSRLVFFITSKYPASETGKNTELIKQLDGSIKWLAQNTNGKIKAEYYGGVAAAVANANQIKKDIYLTISLAFCLIFIVLGFYYRSPTILFIIIPPIVFSGTMALAIMYLIKGTVSVISIAIGSVLLGIAVEFALHIYTHFKNKPDLKHVFKDLTLPIAIASITTASAFLCLYLVRSEAMHDLGLFASLSIMVSALFSLLFLPHFMGTPKPDEKSSWLRLKLERLLSYPFHYNKLLIGLVVILSLFFIIRPGHVRFEDDMYKLNYETNNLKKAGENLDKISNFTQKSIYLISSGTDFNEALTKVAKSDTILQNLKSKGIISSYTTTSSLLIPMELQNQRVETWNAFWSPERKKAVMEALYSNGRKYKFNQNAFSGVEALLYDNYTGMQPEDFEKLRTTFFNDLTTLSGNKAYVTNLVRVDHNNKFKVYDKFDKVEGIQFFDKGYIMHNLVEMLKQDFNKLLAASMIIVVLIYLVSFGRIELAILTFIPILLSWFWILGIMEMTGAKFTIFNIIISTFIFGLGDDFSILIMRGLLQKHKYGEDDLPSYKISIFLSAFTAMVGIGILAFAKHPALKSIAFLSVIGILTVVVLSFILLPVLFRVFILNGKDKNILPVTISDILTSIITYAILLVSFVIIAIIRLVTLILPKKLKIAVARYLIFILSKIVVTLHFSVRKLITLDDNSFYRNQNLIFSKQGPLFNLLILLSLKPGIGILYHRNSKNSMVYNFLALLGIAFKIDSQTSFSSEKLSDWIQFGNSLLYLYISTEDIQKHKNNLTGVLDKINVSPAFIVLNGMDDCISSNEIFIRKGFVFINIQVKFEISVEEFLNKPELIKEFPDALLYFVGDFKTHRDIKKYLIKRYVFKGPVLEGYLRIKLKLENYYNVFNSLIPNNATIADLGCGYGFMSHAMICYNPDRRVTGYDYDADKISIAENSTGQSKQLTFINADITEVRLSDTDVVLLSDVLHYLSFELRTKTLENAIRSLKPGGKIIVRDGNTSMQKRHLGTRFTEFFSTQTGFNKTADTSKKLYFFSDSEIIDIFKKHNLSVEIIDKSQFTSNIIYIGIKPA